MKKFLIHVNGKAYEVEVEELTEETVAAVSAPREAPGPSTRVAAPAVPPEAPKPSEPVAAPASPPAQPAAAAKGDEVIVAPMPGKILAIKVKKGQAVKEGDLILVMEAMKMENDIFCSRAGIVKEIPVTEMVSVNTGDILAVIG